MDKGEEARIFNIVNPIVSMDVYKSGVVVKREMMIKKDRTERGKIKKLSRSSLARLAFIASNTEVEFGSIMTLTYPYNFPLSGKVAKLHLKNFLRGFLPTEGIENYLWVLEFQSRGAPHYHVLLDSLEPNKWQRARFSESWTKTIVGENVSRETIRKIKAVHNHPRSWEKVRKSDGAKRYMLKYALKVRQKIVPENFRDVGRVWGCSRKVRPMPIVSGVDVDDDTLRMWLEQRGRKMQTYAVLPKHIILFDKERGEK